MTAPINTYNSIIDLNLGQVPQVDDEVLYQALLDIHNAIEALVTGTDGSAEYVTKKRNITLAVGDYQVVASDGLIITDTTAGNLTITLPPMVADQKGYEYEIKQVKGSNETLVIGDSGDLVDSDAGGITIDLLEAISVKNDGTEWWLNN